MPITIKIVVLAELQPGDHLAFKTSSNEKLDLMVIDTALSDKTLHATCEGDQVHVRFHANRVRRSHRIFPDYFVLMSKPGKQFKNMGSLKACWHNGEQMF